MAVPTLHDTADQREVACSGPVVEMKDVTFGYESDAPVIRSVSAALIPGRVCALIGPNASGKSTLLKLMLGHLSPWSGGVALAGQAVEELGYSQRASWVSYVPQKGGVSFAFTVRQVVEMGRYALKSRGDEVDRALQWCDLSHLADRVYAHLSGGQQQRVLLARAVAQSLGTGRVMLLDEPASGMDLRHIHDTMRLLAKLAHGDMSMNGAGLGVLVVLHDVNLAARYADDVWLMDGGKLVASGPVGQVMRPEVLEPVYGVKFRPITSDGSVRAEKETRDRPVFWIDPADTMNEV